MDSIAASKWLQKNIRDLLRLIPNACEVLSAHDTSLATLSFALPCVHTHLFHVKYCTPESANTQYKHKKKGKWAFRKVSRGASSWRIYFCIYASQIMLTHVRLWPTEWQFPLCFMEEVEKLWLHMKAKAAEFRHKLQQVRLSAWL